MPQDTDNFSQQAVAETVSTFHVEPEQGLSQANILERLAQYGYNEIEENEGIDKIFVILGEENWCLANCTVP